MGEKERKIKVIPFEGAMDLERYINDFFISQSDIVSIVHNGRKFYLFYYR